MILLDTNVISEMFKPTPSPCVMDWLDRQKQETIYISAITQAELKFGVHRLPDGARKERLLVGIDAVLDLFKGHILPFDEAAAECLAVVAAKAEKDGKSVTAPDGYIAAIALSHNFVVATRNEKHFEPTGVATISPWNQ